MNCQKLKFTYSLICSLLLFSTTSYSEINSVSVGGGGSPSGIIFDAESKELTVAVDCGGVRHAKHFHQTKLSKFEAAPLPGTGLAYDSIRALTYVNEALYVATKQGEVYRKVRNATDSGWIWENFLKLTNQVTISTLYADPRKNILYIGTGSIHMRHRGINKANPTPETEKGIPDPHLKDYGVLISFDISDDDKLYGEIELKKENGKVELKVLEGQPNPTDIKVHDLFPDTIEQDGSLTKEDASILSILIVNTKASPNLHYMYIATDQGVFRSSQRFAGNKTIDQLSFVSVNNGLVDAGGNENLNARSLAAVEDENGEHHVLVTLDENNISKETVLSGSVYTHRVGVLTDLPDDPDDEDANWKAVSWPSGQEPGTSIYRMYQAVQDPQTPGIVWLCNGQNRGGLFAYDHGEMKIIINNDDNSPEQKGIPWTPFSLFACKYLSVENKVLYATGMNHGTVYRVIKPLMDENNRLLLQDYNPTSAVSIVNSNKSIEGNSWNSKGDSDFTVVHDIDFIKDTNENKRMYVAIADWAGYAEDLYRSTDNQVNGFEPISMGGKAHAIESNYDKTRAISSRVINGEISFLLHETDKSIKEASTENGQNNPAIAIGDHTSENLKDVVQVRDLSFARLQDKQQDLKETIYALVKNNNNMWQLIRKRIDTIPVDQLVNVYKWNIVETFTQKDKDGNTVPLKAVSMASNIRNTPVPPDNPTQPDNFVSTLVIGTEQGVYASIDGGTNISRISITKDWNVVRVRNITADSYLVVTTSNEKINNKTRTYNEIHKISFDGEDWSVDFSKRPEINTNTPLKFISDIIRQDGYYYISDKWRGLLRISFSDWRDSKWQELKVYNEEFPDNPLPTTDINVLAKQPGKLYLGTHCYGTYEFTWPE